MRSLSPRLALGTLLGLTLAASSPASADSNTTTTHQTQTLLNHPSPISPLIQMALSSPTGDHDFVQYQDLSGWQNPVQMGPGNEVDFLADFDGSVVAEGYNGLPTLIYTAVKGLPISWTIPYTDGYESQALAYSEDNGTTWTKLQGGANVPVIPRPPYSGNVVTGFRDPFIFRNTQFDSLLNISSADEAMHYVSMSSGLHPSQPGLSGVEFDQAGPRIWLYRQSQPGDWLNWTFCGPLLASRINTTFVTPGSGWAGTDYSDGNNYETSQITNLDFSGDASLSEGSAGMGFISYGAESNRTMMLYRLGHWTASAGINSLPINATVAANVSTSSSGVELVTALEGVLDWGLAYACTGLRDETTTTPRRIVYCWIKEAFTSQDQTKFVTQWISSLTLPREVFVKKVENVVNNQLILQNASWAILNTTFSSKDRIETIPVDEWKNSSVLEKQGVDLVMLGIAPARELVRFRKDANDSFHLDAEACVSLSPANLTTNSTDGELKVQVRQGVPSGTNTSLVDELYVPLPHHPASRHYEISTALRFPPSSLRNTTSPFSAGLSILRRTQPNSNTDIEDITIVYHPANESIIIQKRTALGPKSVLTAPEIGKLRLWQFAGPEGKVEDLNMRVFVDGSAIEVYINDVFVMTTRGYYWYQDSVGVGFVYQLPHGQDVEGMRVEWRNTSWWEGLIDAYPNRPKDAGQLIRQDIGYPEPTNNPNAQGIVYNGTGPAPTFPNLG
ncbi:related to Sucrose-6-phosphate hydrolase [Ustilago trichophora]|uniref:Related to Sucrose-6-phosphate hydrolase n=1 Tax=Ustilago trichophora TaxID=86804 RepID=A0A5C3EHI3_9BASI|nr:related to Sucrose-6-phosphate hydrolase [Ustilago trichophora]